MPLIPVRPHGVLLVEDDPADAGFVQEALLRHGPTRSVTRVPDGVAALEHLRDPGRARPDLIVLDLNLPRMDGSVLLATLKNDVSLRAIPVVVFAATTSPARIGDAYRRHANAYVAKPVDPDEFEQAVHRIGAFFLDTAAVLPRGMDR
jgi:CheY-like chemotaxis protein